MSQDTYTKQEMDARFKSGEEKNDAWSADILNVLEKNHVEQIERYDALEKKIDPLLKIYDGAGFVKSFLVGGGTVILSVGAMGAGLLWILNWIRHG